MDTLTQIESDIQNCFRCHLLTKNGQLCINQKQTGLTYNYPRNENIKVMLVAESPPKPGNGFFYNNSTNNWFRGVVFKLINLSKLTNKHINNLNDFDAAGFYLADSINCRWDKNASTGTLSNQVFKNCCDYLIRQIALLRPQAIITFGKKAENMFNKYCISSSNGMIPSSQIESEINERKLDTTIGDHPDIQIINLPFPGQFLKMTHKEMVNEMNKIKIF